MLSVFIVNPSPTRDSPKKTRTNTSALSTPSRKNRAYVLIPVSAVSSNNVECYRKTPPTPSPTKKKGYVANLTTRITANG
jgi:hypothetical protein